MSQIPHLGPSFHFMSKKRVAFLNVKTSTFHKIRTKALIKILGHASLHPSLMNACLRFQRVLWNIERDINVQKMFTKRQIFAFPGLYFGKFPMHINMHYIMRKLTY